METMETLAETKATDQDRIGGERSKQDQHDEVEREDKVTQLPSPLPTPTSSSSRSPAATPHLQPDSEPEEVSRGRSTAEFTVGSSIAESTTIAEPNGAAPQRRRNSSSTKPSYPDGVRRLSASKMQELTESLPIAAISDRRLPDHPLSAGFAESSTRPTMADQLQAAEPYHGSLHSDGAKGQSVHPSRPAASTT